MNRRTALTALAALALAALFTSAARAQTSYTVVDVGLLPGTAYNYPNAISPNAEVVGKSKVKSGAQYVLGHAFYWSQASGIVDIGVVGAGDTFSLATGINSNGEVAGYSGTSNSDMKPFHWKWDPITRTRRMYALPLGSMVKAKVLAINDFGTILGYGGDNVAGYALVWQPDGSGGYNLPVALQDDHGGFLANVGAINNDGVVTGMYTAADGSSHACIWVPSGGVYGLPTDLDSQNITPSGWNGGTFINGQGWVIGNRDYSFFWSAATGMEPLLDLNGTASNADPVAGTGGPTVYITGLNFSGQAAGNAAAPSSATHAVLWQNGATGDLGTLGGTNSYAMSSYSSKTPPSITGFTINGSGLVVGYSQTNGNKALHAFVWSAGLGMRDLNNLTPSKAGFTALQDGTAINDAGVITGTGVVKTAPIVLTHAYVAFPNF